MFKKHTWKNDASHSNNNNVEFTEVLWQSTCFIDSKLTQEQSKLRNLLNKQ